MVVWCVPVVVCDPCAFWLVRNFQIILLVVLLTCEDFFSMNAYTGDEVLKYIWVMAVWIKCLGVHCRPRLQELMDLFGNSHCLSDCLGQHAQRTDGKTLWITSCKYFCQASNPVVKRIPGTALLSKWGTWMPRGVQPSTHVEKVRFGTREVFNKAIG